MAIGSVYDLVDYKQETIKLAKKYGGELEDKVDSDVIADVYDPDGISGYSEGDAVMYEGNLYTANEDVLNQAGDWKIQSYVAEYDPTMWYMALGGYVTYNGSLYKNIAQNNPQNIHYPTDPQYWELVEGVEDFDASETYSSATVVKYLGRYAKALDSGRTSAYEVPTYSEGSTYNTGQYIVYNSAVYKSVQETSTTWVDDEWENVEAEDWSPTDSFKIGDVILHNGTYYRLYSPYKNLGPNGTFDPTKWTEITVEAFTILWANKAKIAGRSLKSTASTDEHGYVREDALLSGSEISGRLITIFQYPYYGQLPTGPDGIVFTKVGRDYWLVETVTDGVRAPLASTSLNNDNYVIMVYYSTI